MKRIGIAVLTLAAALAAAEASVFKLKNMPEKFATVEGAIVERDDQTIAIMTEDSLLIRAADTVEIVEETPYEDEQFIKEHGPSNAEYQAYLEQKDTAPLEPAAPSGESIAPEGAETEGRWKSVAKPGESLVLRYDYEEGKTSYMVMDTTTVIGTKVGPQSIPATLRMAMVLSAKIVDVDPEGVAEYSIGFEEIDGQMEMGGRKQPMPSGMFKSSESQTLRVDRRGQLVGGDTFEPAAMMGAPGGLTNQMSTNVFAAFPEKAVSVGERWTVEESVEVPGSDQTISMNSSSVLSDIVEMDGDRVAVIDSTVTMRGEGLTIDPSATRNPNAPPTQRGEVTIDKMTTVRELVSYFSLSKNTVVYMEDNMRMTMEMADAGPAGGMNMSMNMEGVYRIVDEKP